MARKKDAHHGGAWKVAFADFMTAMMALFLVLWISAQDKEILIATSQYFQSPFNSPLDNTNGVLPYQSNATPRGEGGEDKTKANEASIKNDTMQALAREFYRLLNVSENDPDPLVRVDVSSDGLRVTLFDRNQRPLFLKDSTDFTEWGKMVIENLAWMIDRQKFRIVVEGHSRAGIATARDNYNEWDLSSDQANAVRRTLTLYAVEDSRFERVSGFGAAQPLPGEAPDSAKNQRITLSLSLYNKVPETEANPKQPAAKKTR